MPNLSKHFLLAPRARPARRQSSPNHGREKVFKFQREEIRVQNLRQKIRIALESEATFARPQRFARSLATAEISPQRAQARMPGVREASRDAVEASKAHVGAQQEGATFAWRQSASTVGVRGMSAEVLGCCEIGEAQIHAQRGVSSLQN